MSELKILVADDSAPIRLIIKKFLSDAGFEVSFAKDGRESLSELRNTKFDLAFVDMQMPEMDGPEVVSKARSMGLVIPIFGMTTFDESDLNLEKLGRYFTGFLNKPILKENLLEIVNNFAAKQK
jgi:CheY-like chemotaxis protein